MSEEFLAEIDAALPGLGYGDRSSFIRDAVFAEMARNGVRISPEIKAAPSRAGKGGSPSHRKSKVVDLKLNQVSSQMVAEDLPVTGRGRKRYQKADLSHLDEGDVEKKG